MLLFTPWDILSNIYPDDDYFFPKIIDQSRKFSNDKSESINKNLDWAKIFTYPKNKKTRDLRAFYTTYHSKPVL